MTPQDMAASLPEKAKTEKQLTKTVLPSGAVVISSKSPVKQTRPTSPNSGDLTGVRFITFYNIDRIVRAL